MPMQTRRPVHLVCVLAVAWISGVCLGDEGSGGHPAIARPSKDVVLSFVQPGRVSKILVEEGDVVKTGQVLVRLDDAAEKIRVEKLKLQADDTSKVKASEARWSQAKVDLARLELAAKEGAATKLEVEHAKLDATIERLRIELARLEQAQYIREHQEAKIRLDRMKLRSPIDGRVEQLFVSEGESPNAHAKVIRLVKIDPLWIDVPVPLVQAKGYKEGQKVMVTFAGQAEPVSGKIVYKSAVGDPASYTLTIRVEVGNPTSSPAGEHVKVDFGLPKEKPAPSAEGAGASGGKDQDKDESTSGKE